MVGWRPVLLAYTLPLPGWTAMLNNVVPTPLTRDFAMSALPSHRWRTGRSQAANLTDDDQSTFASSRQGPSRELDDQSSIIRAHAVAARHRRRFAIEAQHPAMGKVVAIA